MVMTSDHKPVFSSFDVGIISQFAGTRSVSSLTDKSDVMIIFENVKAEVSGRIFPWCCYLFTFVDP